ncbi:MAG: serine hydrolase [Planctomycetota bacterium]|nr:serine hydrolase [Planctomycetota bacterium]
MPSLVAPAALCLSLVLPSQELAQDAPTFPPTTALAEGLSPDALAGLEAMVQGFVDDREIVGAELMVIQSGRTVLHEAYGWSDLEAELPLQKGSVFCVRSMTKPLIGTAVLMLVDDRVLSLDDKVAEHLPAFDVDGAREITIEQLLRHTSGLPMSLILSSDLDTLLSGGGIQAVAALGAAHGPDTPPGTAFEYSDQGTDTLTALIGAVTGAPPEDFLRARILEPLGMTSSTFLMTEDDPLRARALSKYAGTAGSWVRFWSPEDPPLFPFFLGSQGLYASLEDYARFLTFWLDKGRAPGGALGRERLLGTRFQRKALTPTQLPFPGSTAFPGVTTHYGMLMQLWMSASEEPELVAFGHSGSDGTYAWAFPEHDAIVLYFTQSRGTLTGLRVEEALGELFLGVPYDTNLAAPPFDDYLGYYYEGGDDRYRTIVRDGEDLALEILGTAVVPLTFIGDDSWKLRPQPSSVIVFDRDDQGSVIGYHIGDHFEFRLQPEGDLPTVAELCRRVTGYHRIDLLESVGPVRMTAELAMESADIEGDFTMVIAAPRRLRADATMGAESEQIVVDGERVEVATSLEPANRVEGDRAASLCTDIPQARYGDWRQWFEDVEVIQRIQSPKGAVLLVRAGKLTSPCTTFYVEEATGCVIRQDSRVHLPFGILGQELSFGDYQDVGGMQLPTKSETRLAMNGVGAIVTTFTNFELGVELDEDTFQLVADGVEGPPPTDDEADPGPSGGDDTD